MTAIPVYQQIMADLEQRIADLEPGSRLPSEATLATEYGVNRLTVREALAVLGRRGLVTTAQGKGTFVRPTVQRYEIGVGREASLSRAMRAEGRTVASHLLDECYDSDPPEWLPWQTGPWRVRTLRIVDGETWSLTTTWFDPVRLTGISEYWPSGGSLYDTLAERYGIHLIRRDRSFAAIPADPECSRRLGLELGMPVLRMRG